MSRYLIDTNIIIYTLRGVKSVVSFMDKLFNDDRAEILYSVVTEAELFSRELDDDIKVAVEDLLSVGEIVDISSAIARKAGEIRAKFNKCGIKVKLPDALIAATAINEDAILVTHNVQDFIRVVEVKVTDPVDNGEDL